MHSIFFSSPRSPFFIHFQDFYRFLLKNDGMAKKKRRLMFRTSTHSDHSLRKLFILTVPNFFLLFCYSSVVLCVPSRSPGARGKHRRHYAALAALNALGLPTYEIKNEGGQDEPEIPPLSFVTVPKEGKGQVPMSRVPVTGSLNLLDDASTLSTSLRRKFNCNFL